MATSMTRGTGSTRPDTDSRGGWLRKALPFLVFGVITGGAALVGGLASAGTTDSQWYRELDKPSFNPPSWVFSPVWTILYVMMAAAAAIVWNKGSERRDVRISTALFGLQLALNTLWSVLFFGQRTTGGALIEIVVLWFAIVAWYWSAARIESRTRWLILPYIAWVSFATMLNASIWWLNT
jgi:tryptophan-rich sensory protein